MTPIWSPEFHHPFLAVIVEPLGDLPISSVGQERHELVSIHRQEFPFHDRVARGSGIVAPASPTGELYSDRRGRTPIWFEGRIYDKDRRGPGSAEPEPFLDKVRLALSRMEVNYGTVACSEVRTDLLHPVALFDLDRRRIGAILDRDAFERLVGEEIRWHVDPEELPEETDYHRLIEAGVVPDVLPNMLRLDGPGTTSNGFLVWREGDRFFALHATDPRLPPVMDRLGLDDYERRAVLGRQMANQV
ncbi:hypothetical protein LAZ40_05490 [Cereibacter sphaeroides]|uniref:hypothetical protein n=1 Tax=Cereibacter sphaeroides TaxID=1063 RepID=UPI001F45E0E0|nr:hypothetical protein [Cereibacter sphaeroides]MCE6958502.1 hypothetical protein [Cereibacter sphaeroides]MCE6972836.1 hypothetical protein [Cereibacter sphaeroides]